MECRRWRWFDGKSIGYLPPTAAATKQLKNAAPNKSSLSSNNANIYFIVSAAIEIRDFNLISPFLLAPAECETTTRGTSNGGKRNRTGGASWHFDYDRNYNPNGLTAIR